MTINQSSWGQAYPWGAFADFREAVLVTSDAPTVDKSVVPSANGPDIVVPQYGRVCLRFEVEGTSYFTPWVAVTVSPLLIPIARDIRREYEVIVESNTGQALTFEVINASDLDRIN